MRFGFRTKLLLGTTGLIVGFVGFALVALSYLVSEYASSQATERLTEAQENSARVVGRQRRVLRQQAAALSELVTLRAALDRQRPDDEQLDETLTALRTTSGAPFVAIGRADGRQAHSQPEAADLVLTPTQRPAIAAALRGDQGDGLWEVDDRLYLVSTAAIHAHQMVIGWLAIGRALDDGAAAEISQATGREVIIVHGDRMVAECCPSMDGEGLPQDRQRQLIRSLHHARTVDLATPEDAADLDAATHHAYREVDVPWGLGPVAVALQLHPDGGTLVLLRDHRGLKTFRQRAHAWLIAGGMLVVLLGILFSLHLARQFDAPLRDLLRASDTLANGDLSAQARLSGTDELSALADSFNTMARRTEKLVAEVRSTALQAEHANRAKDRFLASVSHELRTPLTSIRAYAEILMTYGDDAAADDRDEFLAIIHNECERLTRLFENVLDFVTLTARESAWSLDRFEVGALARAVVESLNEACGDKQVHFEVRGGSAPYVGDRARIQQVIANLVTNAWKFSPPGETVCIDVERRGDGVRIEVTDRGPGIRDKETKEAVFAMFYQEGDVLTDKPQGIGLGLAIAREIVDMHGGSTMCHDREGGGMVFVVELPDGAIEEPRPIDEHATGKAADDATAHAIKVQGSVR